ncbi:MAG TPA: tetratricopeptide repeat protein [Candidatus Desulfobacillus sp.]|nr:tetratricopeptide repeat protein [Candidatus Desulfobacillus sp.]
MSDPGKKPSSRATLVASVAALLAALAGGAYYFFQDAQPPAAEEKPADSPHSLAPDKTADMAASLAARLAEKPDDAEGWDMLARTYASLGRFQEAADAYARLAALLPDDAQVLADRADVLAMARSSFEGEPEKLVARALVIDPDNAKALAIAGNIAFERQDYAGASQKWQRLLAVAPQSSMARALADRIAEAGAKGKGAPPPPPPAAAAARSVVSGRVELDPAVKDRVAPGDTVFIFVRAAEGPRAPLAARRAQVRDLPLDFVFNDADSLSPERKLSAVPAFVVVARISRSGDTAAGSGDIEAVSPPLAPGDDGVRLRLGRR